MKKGVSVTNRRDGAWAQTLSNCMQIIFTKNLTEVYFNHTTNISFESICSISFKVQKQSLWQGGQQLVFHSFFSELLIQQFRLNLRPQWHQQRLRQNADYKRLEKCPNHNTVKTQHPNQRSWSIYLSGSWLNKFFFFFFFLHQMCTERASEHTDGRE